MPALMRPLSRALPMLSTLAALGLAAAPAAHAKNLVLNNGDIVTVSNLGTHNADPTGTPVTAATKYYTNASGIFAAVETDGTSTFHLGAGGTLVDTQGTVALLAEGSGTINVTDGTITSDHQLGVGLDAIGTGTINVSGGVITSNQQYGIGLIANGSSTVNISGGALTGGDNGYGVFADDNSAATPMNVTGGTISAGSYGYALLAEGSSGSTGVTASVNVSGGTFTGGDHGAGLYNSADSATTISGGSFAAGGNGVGVFDYLDGTVTITGGTFTAGLNGVDLSTLSDGEDGSIDLYGSFTDPMGVLLTPGETESLPINDDSHPGATGSFFGTLENDTLGQTFSYRNNGTITLHDVAATPEPSAFVGLGIGLLGLSVLGVKARKRSA